jgi:uncharacterized protein (TIGR02145 family)
MATARNNWLVPVLLFAALLVSCRKPADDPQTVEAFFKVTPESGSTTTSFELDASQTLLDADEEHPVLVRYDWQGDGIWEQEYTTDATISHRFLKPGSYNIRMEARNMSGLRDTFNTSLIVVQGYSAPTVDLQVLPDSANIFTAFTFSAARSFDDEDSMNLLTFRWDFDGDGSWDTGFDSPLVYPHNYPGTGKYLARVEVMDPTGRSSVAKRLVTVDLLNDSILPQFTADGGFCTVSDIFHFDASGSRVKGRENPTITYSWDIFADNLWEETDLATPLFNRIIRKEGIIKVKLRVTDERGLYMDTICKVEVFPMNTLPEVKLTLGNPLGNTGTEYLFHCIGTHDRETSILDLAYQWDINGDGRWDPEFNNHREIKCRFSTTGKHPVSLRVTDGHEDSVVKTDTVYVFEGDHETALLADKRIEGQIDYYGIVRIGDLWWMQENLRFYKEPTKDNPGVVPMAYGRDTTLWEKYGGLYSYNQAIRICPLGWRLPTKAEFQALFTTEAKNSIPALLFGGDTEFHAKLGGYIDFNGRSVGFGSITHFWLGDQSPNNIPSAWYIDRSKGESKAVMVSKGYGFSVRCVRQE